MVINYYSITIDPMDTICIYNQMLTNLTSFTKTNILICHLTSPSINLILPVHHKMHALFSCVSFDL